MLWLDHASREAVADLVPGSCLVGRQTGVQLRPRVVRQVLRDVRSTRALQRLLAG